METESTQSRHRGPARRAAHLPASGGFCRSGDRRQTTPSTGGPTRTRKAFWRDLGRTSSSAGSRSRPRGSDWDPPHCTWFADGELNVAWNCLDRPRRGRSRRQGRLPLGRRADGESADAHVRRPAARGLAGSPTRLQELGVEKGDRVGDLHGRWSRSCRSRCSPARASARRTSSSSAASRPSRSASGIDDCRRQGRSITAGRGLAQGRQGAV